ncbi:hypothetical protein GY45DRAFT_1374297 [Cubamyces sp. BRFM 1775]|nr:hypothetical protein GY45DRAFT_1374297 [Cubamyces sp. BRFM 1775]
MPDGQYQMVPASDTPSANPSPGRPDVCSGVPVDAAAFSGSKCFKLNESHDDEIKLRPKRIAEYAEQLQPLPQSMSNDLITTVRKAILRDERVHLYFGFFLTAEEIMKVSANIPMTDWAEPNFIDVPGNKEYLTQPAFIAGLIVSILNKKLSTLYGDRDAAAFRKRHHVSNCASGIVFAIWRLGRGVGDEGSRLLGSLPPYGGPFPYERLKPGLEMFQEMARAVGPKEPMWYFDNTIHGPSRFNYKPFKLKKVVGKSLAKLLRARENRQEGAALEE